MHVSLDKKRHNTIMLVDFTGNHGGICPGKRFQSIPKITKVPPRFELLFRAPLNEIIGQLVISIVKSFTEPSLSTLRWSIAHHASKISHR